VTATRVQDSSSVAGQRGQRILTASFGLVILLLAQYVLGIAYNLYGTAPTPTKKIKLFSSPSSEHTSSSARCSSRSPSIWS
jgi:hypothetical protein